jgi:hypothetical protein
LLPASGAAEHAKSHSQEVPTSSPLALQLLLKSL